MKLNEQLKSYFTKCGHINASFYEGKACINVSLRFRTFYLSLDKQFYNNYNPHSANNGLTPNQKEENYFKKI